MPLPIFDAAEDWFRPTVDKFRSYFKKNGRVKDSAPVWAKSLQAMVGHFPSYYQKGGETFRAEVDSAIAQLEQLKHKEPHCPVPLGNDPSVPDYSEVTEAKLPPVGEPLGEVVTDMVALFEGMAFTSHPLHQSNVLPNANKASIIATILANYTSQNYIEGENAWNTSKAEMESAAMIAGLIDGWDTRSAGGIFTYGGSGCYLYAMKYAISQVLLTVPDEVGKDKGNSRCNGVRVDGKLFCSQQGHYAKMNATDWLGLGMDNIVDIETDDVTNEMDMEDLEEKFVQARDEKVPVIAVVCTMGTTDTFAIDNVARVAELVKQYPNPPGYGRTMIYCDSVIGWIFLTFANYDFKANPSNYDPEVLDALKKSYTKIQNVKYADCLGIDFHKTGWTPYATSMFLTKDLVHFKELLTRPGAAYIQHRTAYSPGLYSLEVSRSGAPAMAAWASLRYLGASGYQAIVGGVLQMSLYLRSVIDDDPSMVCCNDLDFGFVSLVRVYPPGVDAKKQYAKELEDPSAATKKELDKHNQLQKKVADYIWWWLRSGAVIDGLYAPYTTYTSGFRTTNYNDDMGDGTAVVYALKSYPMNVNVTTKTMDQIYAVFKTAREKVLAGEEPKLEHVEAGAPYDAVLVEGVTCAKSSDPSRAKVADLISGVPGGRPKKGGRKF